jgi:hypothetical protein
MIYGDLSPPTLQGRSVYVDKSLVPLESFSRKLLPSLSHCYFTGNYLLASSLTDLRLRTFILVRPQLRSCCSDARKLNDQVRPWVQQEANVTNGIVSLPMLGTPTID